MITDNWGDYDRWKTTDPAEYNEHECERCGENMRRAWPLSLGWRCDRCDEENEYREAQLAQYDGQAHGSPELDADAAKLAAMGQDPGPTFAEVWDFFEDIEEPTP
jgi:hypothetical protein